MIAYQLKSSDYIINVPEKAEELTLQQCLNLNELVKSPGFGDRDNLDTSYDILQTITDYPLHDITFKENNDMITIISNVNLANVEYIRSNVRKWEFNAIEYSTYNTFDELTFGEYYYIKLVQQTKKEMDYIPKVLATLIRPATYIESDEFKGQKKVILKKFDVFDINARSRLFMNTSLNNIYHIINEFNRWDHNLMERYPEIYRSYETDSGGMKLSPIKIPEKWTYTSMLMNLTGGDITKTDMVFEQNITQVFVELECKAIRDQYYAKINRIANASQSK